MGRVRVTPQLRGLDLQQPDERRLVLLVERDDRDDAGRSHLPRYDHVLMARFRFMVIDEDGQRIGRFESGDPNWRAGDSFTLDEQLLRILEILPEVSTMVAYNAVWVATPATDDEQPTYPAAPVAEAQGRTRI